MPTLSTKKLAARSFSALSLDTFYTASVSQSGWGPNARLYDGSSEGETWALTLGNGTLAINTSNQGTYTGTTLTSSVILGSQSVGDCDVSVTWSADTTNSSVGIVARRQPPAHVTYYRVHMQPANIAIDAVVNGTITNIATPSFTWTASTLYRMRVRVIGSQPTVLLVKVWAISGAEPSTWTWAGPDTSSGISASGNYGVFAKPNTTGSVVTFDHFVATDAAPARRFLGGRFNLGGGKYISSRFQLSVQRNKKLSSRFNLTASASLLFASRFRLKIAIPTLLLGGRYNLQVQRNRRFAGRILVSAQRTPAFHARYKLASQPKHKSLGGRFFLVQGNQGLLGGRFNLVGPPPFPVLPPGASSLSYHGATVVPVIPSGEYLVFGVPIDAPLVCTAPESDPNSTFLAGSTFILLFTYTIYTLGVLVDGSTVSLTFAIPGGRMVTAPVQVASTVQNGVLSVVCTLLSDLPLSDVVISTPFS